MGLTSWIPISRSSIATRTARVPNAYHRASPVTGASTVTGAPMTQLRTVGTIYWSPELV